MRRPELKSLLLQCGLVVLVLIVYWPMFYQGLSNYDDPLVVEPLRKIHSLSQYFQAIRSTAILDYQPVRDLSLWLDWKMIEVYPTWNFHYQNALYWILIVLIQFRILNRLIGNTWISWATVLILSIHPVFSSTLLWVTARKHILSGLLTFLTLLLVLKASKNFKERIQPRRMLLIAGTFILALLSQPITIFFPLSIPLFAWYLATGPDKLRSFFRKWSHVWIPLFVISTLVGVFNYHYYKIIFEQSDLTTPKIQLSAYALKTFFSFVPMIIGRYLYQVFVPLLPSVTTYSFGTSAGLIGLSLWLLIYLGSGGVKKPKNWVGVAFFFLIIAPVTFIPNQNLGNDTYIFVASFGIFFWLAGVVKGFLAGPYASKIKYAWIPVILIVGTLSQLTRTFVREWDSSYDRIYAQVNREPTGIYYIQMAIRYMVDRRYADALWAFQESRLYPDRIEQSCYGSFLGYLIYYNPLITTEDRKKLLREEVQLFLGVRLHAAFFEEDQNELGRAVIVLNSIPAEKKALVTATCSNFTPSMYRLWGLCEKIKNTIPLNTPPLCHYVLGAKDWAKNTLLWTGDTAK